MPVSDLIFSNKTASREPLKPNVNLLSLLIPFNPLHQGRGGAVIMENDQQIADLHVLGIFNRNRYTDPSNGLVRDRGVLPFISDGYPRFGFVWREPNRTTEL
jgi:hypothetical protein